MRKKPALLYKVMIAGLLTGGLILLAQGLIVPAKAYLSVHLINHAWGKTLEGQDNVQPWPWMESSPIAKLSFDQQEKSFVVMEGVSGPVLAFAPGWHPQTAYPGKAGVSVLSAHRDTHFRILKTLRPGDILTLQTGSNKIQNYAVTHYFINKNSDLKIDDQTEQSIIYLTTCYPFEDLGGNSTQRYVVVAKAISLEI